MSVEQVTMSILDLLKSCLLEDYVKVNLDGVDWAQVDGMARRHKILPLVMQGTARLPFTQRPPEEMIKAWKSITIGTVLRNERSMLAQDEATASLQAVGIPCAVLKGTSVAALYPRPELRSLGDIDLLVPKEQCAAAAKLLEADGYHKRESDHAFHIRFDKDDISLELHYAVTEFPNSIVGVHIKEKLHNAAARAKVGHIGRHRFPILSESDQALSLLLHMERHMVASGIGLRQLCDWNVFIGSLDRETLQNDVLPVIEECKLLQFAGTLTKICVLYLGLDANRHRWCMHLSNRITDELLADIIASGGITHGELERITSSTFVKGEEGSAKKESFLKSGARNLTVSAKKQFPVCTRFPVLLPIFWMYLPVRYVFRSIKGTRPKQSLRKIVKYAWTRKKLYRKLELFRR